MIREAWLIVVAVLVVGQPAVAANDWPQYGYNETHQSAVPASLNTEFAPFLAKWWNDITTPARPGAASVFENVVYVGDSNGELHALDRESGGKLWTVPTAKGTAIEGAPAAGRDAVYVLNIRGAIYAFDRKVGTPIPGFPVSIGGTPLGSVLFHTQQNLLVAAGGSTVKAIFANSQDVKWTFAATGLFFGNQTTGVNCQGGSIEGSPVIFEDYVFFGSTNKCFFAVDNRAFGTIAWSATSSGSNSPVWIFQAENSIRSSPTIDATNRRVIFGDLSGNMYAIPVASTGKVVPAAWKYKEPLAGNLPSEFQAGAAIADPNVIVASRNGNVRALSLASGTVAWTRSLSQEIVATPAVANSKILVGTFAGTMYMLNVTDGGIADQRSALDKLTTPPIITGTQGIWTSNDRVLHSWGGQKPPRADLAVTRLTASLIVSQAGSIQFTVKNQGVLPAPNTTATLTVGTTKLGDLEIPALAPNAEHTGNRPYTATARTALSIKLILDSGRLVPESDESNNEKILSVTPSPPPVTEQPPTTESPAGGPAPSGALLFGALLIGAILVSRRRRDP